MSTETLNEDDDNFVELSSNKNSLSNRKPFVRGSDPRIATCRGKLQNKRSKLNQEINKELRLRAGAENLYKATTNRKLRETVALELSFVNSNLQLLKEQLAELNSSVELYQNDSKDAVIPMIPLGLKETKEIDFREPFKDFILEHYSEDAAQYEDAIADLMDTRQAMRTPLRDSQGVALLFRYYNQLYFLERRFFPPDRSLGIYFEWYDSLTGVPSCQRTVAFEKACVLFNIGAVYTQIGTKQDRLTAKGLDSAVDSFLRAAGTFRYIHENFTNAPSMDLGPEMLEMLVQLMLAQARECLFEKLELQSHDNRDIDIWLDLAQEAAQVGEIYGHVHQLITCDPVKDYVPYSWIALVNVKKQHYLALSHYHCAMGILSEDIMKMSASTKETLHFLHVDSGSKTQLDIKVPVDDSERKLLGRAHLRESLVMHEESQRLHRMCRELKGKLALTTVLRQSHDLSVAAYSAAENEDDFREVLDPPRIQASTKFQLSLTGPDFAQFRVDDLFKALGPVAIFSAKHHWTAPRLVQLHRGTTNGNTHHTSRAIHKVIQNGGSQCYVSPSRRDISASSSSGNGEHGFGFSVRGDAPVIIAAVDHNSLADFGGVKDGDFIVGIGEKDVKWSSHDEVVKLIKKSGDNLTLKLVTPMDRNYLKPNKTQSHNNNNNSKGSITTNCSGTSSCSVNSIHSSSSGVSSGGLSTTNHSPIGSLSILNNNTHKKHTWNPFKRNSVVSSHRSHHINDNDNVILR